MGIFNRNNNKPIAIPTVKRVAPVIKIDSVHRGLDYLVALVKQIRPHHHKNLLEAELKFKALFYHLQKDKTALFSLRKAVLSQFLNSNFIPAITESGMVSSRGFLQELVIKLKHKLLPPLQQPNDFLYIINHVFYKKSDYVWVEAVDRELWINFFQVLGVQVKVADLKVVEQLNQALHILCQRTITMGLEKEILHFAPQVPYHQYAFVQLDKATQQYLQLFQQQAPIALLVQSLDELQLSLNACKDTIEIISDKRKKKGTSLSQTYLLFRIQQHIDRISLIRVVLDPAQEMDAEFLLNYFIRVIYYEKKKSSLRDFVSANFSFLAFKITEHGGVRGEKYITTSRREYMQMIRSAMQGGFIVSFAAVIKALLGKVAMAPFWQGFAYSVNYAFAFQMMHETNSTLATKQPAFTASALANILNSNRPDQKPDLFSVAIMVARTVRSQLASFFGNLVVVFPLAFLIAALYHVATGTQLVNAATAERMMYEQHPLQSLSIMYACFTGVFLFLSGVIAGFVENGINFGNVGKRLENHAWLKHTLPRKQVEKFTRYIEDNAGALMGNIALGFMLGMAGFFGKIFGIPFDIRHITISAANSAIAVYTRGLSDGLPFVGAVFGGVLLIGFFNFFISFALAFLVAIKSRGLRLRDYPELVGVLAGFFIRFPQDFFFPPKQARTVEFVRERFRKKK